MERNIKTLRRINPLQLYKGHKNVCLLVVERFHAHETLQWISSVLESPYPVRFFPVRAWRVIE